MACTLCMAAPASFALIPCGHVCYCDACVTMAWETEENVCPVCSLAAQTKLKVFFPGEPVFAQPVRAPPVATVEAPTLRASGTLALTDAPHAEFEIMEEVQNVEDWAAGTPRAEDLELEDLMQFLNISLEQNVIELRLTDQERYIDALLAEVGRSWRALALRLHPDKARARSPQFWDEERYTRLKAAFQYANNAQDALKTGLSAWVVQAVEGVHLDYRLTEGNNLTLEVLFQGNVDFETVIRYTNGFGAEKEVVVAPGRGKVVFYQFRQPKFFQDSFSGFALLHRAIYGPAAGSEPCAFSARRPVPE